MATNTQINEFYKKLKTYNKQYMRKQYNDLDESATRLMINSLLTTVLGYKELEEIKTEYRIRGEYADYIVQINRKKQFVVEVKAIQLDLSEKHLRQSTAYAANEGIDWIILTNGKTIELYRVIFGKPITTKKVFVFELTDEKQLRSSAQFLYYLTKKSVMKDELDDFYARFEALEPAVLANNLYAIETIRFLKKVLKYKTGLTFNEEDILNSVHQIITTSIESTCPKTPLALFKKNKKSTKGVLEEVTQPATVDGERIK